MFKKLFSELFILTAKLAIVLIVLAATYLLLEGVKYYQNRDNLFKVASVEFEEDGKLPQDEDLFEDYLFVMDAYESEPNEDDYTSYEEDLPEDIITESGTHEDVTEIPTKPQPISLGKDPLVVIVIDDMGISKSRTKDINSLNYPITSSFLTYGGNLQGQINDSIKAGHEVIAHIPMEAKTSQDAAPDVLKTSMTDTEVKEKLEVMLNKFLNINGINNHMGSKFTENLTKMNNVMEVLKEKNLFFLDSRTSAASIAKEAAEKHGIKYVTRNIFLDNENDLDYIMNQLHATEKVATKKGYAIAIGHPKSQTFEALKLWLPTLEGRGYKLIHLTELVELLNK